MADEALDCFVTLIKSVPEWTTELESISKAVKVRQKEILSENQPPHATGEESTVQKQRKASKSSSLNSNKTSNKNEQQQTAPPTEPTVVQEQIPHMTEADALRLAQRKRKTISAASRQTGPSKYRSRSMVVVYYDGEIQERFEALVRAIGVFRNSLRKGRRGATMDLMMRTGSSSSDASFDGDHSNLSKLSGYPAGRMPMPTLTRSQGVEVFDKADSFLDKAQVLCEKAAHQVLRDGDCVVEVTGAKEHFSSALNIGESALPELRKRAEKAAERQRRKDEEEKLKGTNDEKESEVDNTPLEKVPLIVDSTGGLELEVDDIEADDSDGEDDNAPLPFVHPLSLAGKLQVHSSARYASNRLYAA